MNKMWAVVVLAFLVVGSSGAQGSEAGSVKASAREKSAAGIDGFTDPATGMDFVLVQGGCFCMGDEAAKLSDRVVTQPVRKVCIDDYYMGKFEVTRAQWEMIMGARPQVQDRCEGKDCPVVKVSWIDAQQFVTRLNGRTGKNYRLPTEAEWEYAAKNAGNEYSAAKRKHYDAPSPVSQTVPNSRGIYGMQGNVWEWTADWYGDTNDRDDAKFNPAGPVAGHFRALRGGSWMDKPLVLQPAFRIKYEPNVQREWIGFRLMAPVDLVAKHRGDAKPESVACSCESK